MNQNAQWNFTHRDVKYTTLKDLNPDLRARFTLFVEANGNVLSDDLRPGHVDAPLNVLMARMTVISAALRWFKARPTSRSSSTDIDGVKSVTR